MGTEIERKFLVSSDDWRASAGSGSRLRQGYIAFGPPASVRVRTDGKAAYLNIKKATVEITRMEFEYEIPVEDANQLLDEIAACHIIEKTRYEISRGDHVWEVDVFEGVNAGLTVAEIELDAADEPFERPAWLGAEVSNDPRYLNSHLSRHPFTQWNDTYQ